jgi:hypothetical protein
MPLGWTDLNDDLQVLLARESMRRAADMLAGQAEALANEFNSGSLEDLGAAEALHLFAALVREMNGCNHTVGRA